MVQFWNPSVAYATPKIGSIFLSQPSFIPSDNYRVVALRVNDQNFLDMSYQAKVDQVMMDDGN